VRYSVRNITTVSYRSGSHAVDDASGRPLDSTEFRLIIKRLHEKKLHLHFRINDHRARFCKKSVVSVNEERPEGQQRTIDERIRRMVHGCAESVEGVQSWWKECRVGERVYVLVRIDVRTPCVNTYALTLTNVKKMVNTMA